MKQLLINDYQCFLSQLLLVAQGSYEGDEDFSKVMQHREEVFYMGLFR